jgi:hypothetical protein
MRSRHSPAGGAQSSRFCAPLRRAWRDGGACDPAERFIRSGYVHPLLLLSDCHEGTQDMLVPVSDGAIARTARIFGARGQGDSRGACRTHFGVHLRVSVEIELLESCREKGGESHTDKCASPDWLKFDLISGTSLTNASPLIGQQIHAILLLFSPFSPRVVSTAIQESPHFQATNLLTRCTNLCLKLTESSLGHDRRLFESICRI